MDKYIAIIVTKDGLKYIGPYDSVADAEKAIELNLSGSYETESYFVVELIDLPTSP